MQQSTIFSASSVVAGLRTLPSISTPEPPSLPTATMKGRCFAPRAASQIAAF
jgi:hypothetical protein